MQTLYFTRRFTSGTLVGLTHNDKISFPTLEGCTQWLAAIRRKSKAKKLNYEIIDASFQNYVR